MVPSQQENIVFIQMFIKVSDESETNETESKNDANDAFSQRRAGYRLFYLNFNGDETKCDQLVTSRISDR